jgi:integrase/recombinase XerD
VSFSQFLRERQFLHNVTPATLEWHKHSLKWLRTETPTQDDLKDAVVRMREKGLKATGCNSAIRSINAYLKWSGSSLKISQLKEPQLVLPTLTPQQIRSLVTWKPRGFYRRRSHLLVLFLLDTGCRITEALTLHVHDVDLNNLLVTLDGKGRKQRVVPFSFELRTLVHW